MSHSAVKTLPAVPFSRELLQRVVDYALAHGPEAVKQYRVSVRRGGVTSYYESLEPLFKDNPSFPSGVTSIMLHAMFGELSSGLLDVELGHDQSSVLAVGDSLEWTMGVLKSMEQFLTQFVDTQKEPARQSIQRDDQAGVPALSLASPAAEPPPNLTPQHPASALPPAPPRERFRWTLKRVVITLIAAAAMFGVMKWLGSMDLAHAAVWAAITAVVVMIGQWALSEIRAQY